MSGSSSPRLVVYSQDGLGLGHQRRTTLLASEFLAAKAGASVLTISDSPLGQFFPTSAGHDYLKLPSIHKVGPGNWPPVSLSLPFNEVLEIRREIIKTSGLKFEPDVMLVDHMPHGAMGELVPTLEALKGSGTGSSWVCATSSTRRRWFGGGGIWRARSRWSSSTSTTCFVYGSQDVFDVSTEYDLPDGSQPPAELLRLRLLAAYTLSSAQTRSANATCATPRTPI